MTTCEHHDESILETVGLGPNQLPVKYGNDQCPLCSVASLATAALGLGLRAKRDEQTFQANMVDADGNPTGKTVAPSQMSAEMVACALLMAAFERISFGRWKVDDFVLSSVERSADGSMEKLSREELQKTHPLISPEVFDGLVLLINTAGAEIAPSPKG